MFILFELIHLINAKTLYNIGALFSCRYTEFSTNKCSAEAIKASEEQFLKTCDFFPYLSTINDMIRCPSRKIETSFQIALFKIKSRDTQSNTTVYSPASRLKII